MISILTAMIFIQIIVIMKTTSELSYSEENQLYIHLDNYIIFEKNDFVRKFCEEFKRTFDSNWMARNERCLFRKRLYKRHPCIE